jgi:hypothetical protein
MGQTRRSQGVTMPRRDGAAPEGASPRRRRRDRMVVTATAVTVAAGLVTVIVLAGLGASSATSGSPSASSGVAGSHRTEVPSFAALSRDGRTLTVEGVTGPCDTFVKNRLLVSATHTHVALTLLVQGPAHPKPTGCLLADVAPQWLIAQPQWPSVRLAAPLGSRRVVQGLTGRTIPVFGGASLATPTVLPRGCHLGVVLPTGDILTNAPPYPRGFHPGVTQTCAVAVPFRSTPQRPASTLQLGQWRGWIYSLGLPIERRALVHGHPAVIKMEAYGAIYNLQERSISWHEDGGTFVITSSTSLRPSRAHDRAVLSSRELLAIANGLAIPAPLRAS